MTVFYAKATEKELIIKLDFSNKLALSKYLQSEQERGYKGSYVVTVEREKSKRSNNANAYLWGVVYKLISEHTGHSENELHSIYSRMFLPPKFITYNGKEIKLPTGTSNLDKLEFMKFTDQVIAEASSMGIVIPPPDTQKEEFDIESVHAELEKPEGEVKF